MAIFILMQGATIFIAKALIKKMKENEILKKYLNE